MKTRSSRRMRMIVFPISLAFLIVAPTWAQTTGGDGKSDQKEKISLRLDAGRELHLTATISPIDFTGAGFHERWDELAELKAAVPRKKYTAKAFEAFLPPKPVEVGDTWEIKEDVIQLIRQLHANATLDMHASDATGCWAMLQASSDRFAEITFRIHADIPLVQGFLTFSQFTGRLVINHLNQEIVFFRMYVPDATINFDVNWDESNTASPKRGGYITDAGRCRHVELFSGHRVVVDAINWNQSMSRAESELELARKFYPAWQINWQPMERAYELARRLKKPIHVVSADGPFKDEAC